MRSLTKDEDVSSLPQGGGCEIADQCASRVPSSLSRHGRGWRGDAMDQTGTGF